MELFPTLKIGWLNGWLAVVLLGLAEGVLFLQVITSSLVILGACIAGGSWLAAALWATARVMEHFGILAEEEVCLRQYGESYRAYMKRIPRYFLFF